MCLSFSSFLYPPQSSCLAAPGRFSITTALSTAALLLSGFLPCSGGLRIKEQEECLWVSPCLCSCLWPSGWQETTLWRIMRSLQGRCGMFTMSPCFLFPMNPSVLPSITVWAEAKGLNLLSPFSLRLRQFSACLLLPMIFTACFSAWELIRIPFTATALFITLPWYG